MKIGDILYPRNMPSLKTVRCIRLDRYDGSDGAYTVTVYYHNQIVPVKSMIYDRYIQQYYTTVKPKRTSKYRLPSWF